MLDVLVSIIITVCYGIAASIQKYSFTKMKRFSVHAMIKNKTWLAGLVVGAIGIALYLMALTFVPLSTIQPMLAISVVIPIIAGVIFFKEKLITLEWFCILLIIIGIFLVVI